MQPNPSRFARLLLLLLGTGLLVAIAAQAAQGFRVTKDQEALIKPGMSMDEVRQALGRPSINRKYRNEPGPTFTYEVIGDDDALFDVDFSADNRVATANERVNFDEGGGGHAFHHGRH
jgi:SmpA / OmlA family